MPGSRRASPCARARWTVRRWLTYARLRVDETLSREAPVSTAAVARRPGTPPRYVASGAPFNCTIQRFAGYVARSIFFAAGDFPLVRTTPLPALATVAASMRNATTARLILRVKTSLPLPRGYGRPLISRRRLTPAGASSGGGGSSRRRPHQGAQLQLPPPIGWRCSHVRP